MNKPPPHAQPINFPCHFEFKAFGPGENAEVFFDSVHRAISTVVPISKHAMKSRQSSKGTYQCVSALVTLQNRSQLEAVYSALRKIDDLKYLL